MRRLAFALALLVAASGARAQESLDETRLPLRLVGTVVAARPDRSLAVIESAGSTSVVRRGQSIGGARVEEIGKDGIVIEHASRRERLTFGATSGSGESGSSGAPTATAAAYTPAESGRDEETRPRSGAMRGWRASERARRWAARRPKAVRANFERKRDEAPPPNDQVISDLSRQARYEPLLDDDGKLRGVALVDILPDSTLERFGLQNGDVVTHVAGVKIDNTANAYNALRGINLRGGVAISVVRRGVPLQVVVPPGAF